MKGNARTAGEERRRGGQYFDDESALALASSSLSRQRDVPPPATISLFALDDYLKSDAKRALLHARSSWSKIEWSKILPDSHHSWLTKGLRDDFNGFLPLATKGGAGMHAGEQALMRISCPGV